MGYRIDYGQPSDRKYPVLSSRRPLPALLCGALALFVLLTSLYWPEGREALRDLLIPGDAAVTAEAFAAMLENVRAGEDVQDAVTVFCREILEHGTSPD